MALYKNDIPILERDERAGDTKLAIEGGSEF